MIWSRACEKCSSILLRRSRVRNIGERILCTFLAPYRCQCCDARLFRLRFRMLRVATEPVKQKEPELAASPPLQVIKAGAEPVSPVKSA